MASLQIEPPRHFRFDNMDHSRSRGDGQTARKWGESEGVLAPDDAESGVIVPPARFLRLDKTTAGQPISAQNT